VDDITVEEEGLEHQLFFQAAEAIEPLLMQMQMLTVNQLIGFYFKNSAAAATVVVILRHEPLKVLLVLHPVQLQMPVEQQMHRLPIQFRLNSIFSKEMN
jgi:hypothetical protein